jgi:ribosomal protein L37AE/L43A
MSNGGNIMEIKEILEMLKTSLLTEEQQKDVEQKLNDIIDIKVQEKLNEAIETEKEHLVALYEEKFEDYKNEVMSKFSDFVDTVLEEEGMMEIPDNIREYARVGELYHDVIQEIKSRIGIDEGILDEEVRELLEEARDEITRLRGEINDMVNENLEIKKDARDFAAELYKRKKCDGLTELQRKNVMRLLENIVSQDEIDRKYSVITSHYLKEQNDETTDCSCPDCGKTYVVRGACSMNECDDCNVALEEKEVSEGHSEVKDRTVKKTSNPFEEYKRSVVKVLTENKF